MRVGDFIEAHGCHVVRLPDGRNGKQYGVEVPRGNGLRFVADGAIFPTVADAVQRAKVLADAGKVRLPPPAPASPRRRGDGRPDSNVDRRPRRPAPQSRRVNMASLAARIRAARARAFS